MSLSPPTRLRDAWLPIFLDDLTAEHPVQIPRGCLNDLDRFHYLAGQRITIGDDSGRIRATVLASDTTDEFWIKARLDPFTFTLTQPNLMAGQSQLPEKYMKRPKN